MTDETQPQIATQKKEKQLFFKIIAVILTIVVLFTSIFLVYSVQTDKFGSSVNNSMICPDVIPTICPNLTCPIIPSCNCPNLSCATNTTPQINVNLANLNCTTL